MNSDLRIDWWMTMMLFAPWCLNARVRVPYVHTAAAVFTLLDKPQRDGFLVAEFWQRKRFRPLTKPDSPTIQTFSITPDDKGSFATGLREF